MDPDVIVFAIAVIGKVSIGLKSSSHTDLRKVPLQQFSRLNVLEAAGSGPTLERSEGQQESNNGENSDKRTYMSIALRIRVHCDAVLPGRLANINCAVKKR
jgi:hypothetical protein